MPGLCGSPKILMRSGKKEYDNVAYQNILNMVAISQPGT